MFLEESKIEELREFNLIENSEENQSLSFYSTEKVYEESVENQDANDIKVKQIKLANNIPYSRAVYEFISQHKQWKIDKMANRNQSKDLYRNDNMCKKTWRALRQIIFQKTKMLITSLPVNLRNDPVCVHAKIKSYLWSFEQARDYRTYYTLLPCMLFLAMKRSYAKFIKTLCFDSEIMKFMAKQVKTFKSFNENKTGGIQWRDILCHPVFSLAKDLFYKEEEMQNIFFIKTLGCTPRDTKEDTKTRMTIIDNYEYFRVKLLHTLENKFQDWY